ncbi:efflux transporter outer membrane subunit [Cupriavidus sp. CV2]|uniref:efflux transporter outer membrane subunit n=1 Tax=Cupriavidus ulmosensis TaxID=3065913 RepID=UPI00296A9D62|nr:efflux transporter outer membrane subunit [Cupriavidus sp. CV2]MDW3683562.1 efflux transporter outer membrane subunit [Cupriavidus sp. CV2]
MTSRLFHCRFPIVLATVLFAGCSLIPRYERPAPPLATTYPTGHMVTADRLAIPSVGWEKAFVEPELRQLIGIALENNRDLRAATLNVRRAQARFRIQRAEQWPTVNVAVTQSKQSPAFTQNIAAYGVGLTSYEVDLFGRIDSLKQAALANYLGAASSRQAAQISLVATVAQGYLALLADNQALSVVWEILKAREASHALAELKFTEGAATAVDVRQSEWLVADARAGLAQVERRRSQNLSALVLVLGVPSWPEDVRIDGMPLPEEDTLLGQIPFGLPSDLLTRRPDIDAAEKQLIAANANIGAARAAFFPRITLTGSFGRASPDLSDLFDHATRAWSFAPQLTLPIFDFGANRANLDVAKIDRELAVAQYEKTIQSAFKEVSDALGDKETWARELDAARARLKASAEAHALVALRYREGGANYLEVLDAQRTLLDAQQAVVHAHLASLQSTVSLYKSLGGGWSAER